MAPTLFSSEKPNEKVGLKAFSVSLFSFDQKVTDKLPRPIVPRVRFSPPVLGDGYSVPM